MGIKKFILLVLVSLFILSASANLVFAEETKPINVYIYDELMDMEVKPLIINDSTLVPMREIFEMIGAIVEWNGDTKTVTAITKDKVIKLRIDNRVAYRNNEQINLNVAPQIINDYTYVPVRFIGESLGYEVNWDSNTYSVLINSSYPYGSYQVTEIIGNGTFRVKDENQIKNVHMLGLEVPLENQIDFYDKFKETLMPMGKGTNVALELENIEDDDGVLFAYVWKNGNILNETALKSGLAKKSSTDVKGKYEDILLAAETYAKNSNLGLWGETKVVLEKPSNPKEKIIWADIKDIPVGKFVGNINTMEFHKKECYLITNINRDLEIRFATEGDAINQGFKPCQRCIGN